MSLCEQRVIKLAEETGCSGGIQQSPFLEITKGNPGTNPYRGCIRRMNQTCQDMGRGGR